MALVLGSELDRPVGKVGLGGHLVEADLPDLHPRIDRDGKGGHIRQLEGDVPLEAGVDEPGGRMDEETEPAEG